MSQRDRPRKPARATTRRPPRKRILVFCEGEATEPLYLNACKRWLQATAVHVEIADARGVPLTLIKLAQEAKEANIAQARRDPSARYDEVWCVFDRDEHPGVEEALRRAHAQGIQTAYSNPCFELWLWLHFAESPGAQHRHMLQSKLGAHLAGYSRSAKRLTEPWLTQLRAGYEQAERRAERLCEGAAQMGEEGRNPTTTVYRLTRSMR